MRRIQTKKESIIGMRGRFGKADNRLTPFGGIILKKGDK